MALLFMDGMDNYSSYTQLTMKYSVVSSANYSTTGGRWGGGAFEISDYGSSSKLNAGLLPTIAAGSWMHFAVWVKPDTSAHSSSNSVLMGFKSTTNNTIGIGLIGQYPCVYAYNSSAASALQTFSGGDPFIMNTWSHVEGAFTIADSGGRMKVWINGGLVVDFTGDTAVISDARTIDRFFCCDATTFNGTWYDDLVVWDESGSDFAYTQLGSHRISTLRPSGAGSNTGWTPNTGANYAAVDDAPYHDSDTTYVESATVGDKDSYACGNLSYTPADVFAVNVCARSKDLGTTSTIKPLIKSGSTEATGAARTTSAAYANKEDFFVLDPDTGVAWTPAGVDALEIGFQHYS